MQANPTYAYVRFPNGRESTVSLRDLAPCPSEENKDVSDVEVSGSQVDVLANDDKCSGRRPTSTESIDHSEGTGHEIKSEIRLNKEKSRSRVFNNSSIAKKAKPSQPPKRWRY